MVQAFNAGFDRHSSCIPWRGVLFRSRNGTDSKGNAQRGVAMKPEADMYEAERESVDRTIPDEPEYHDPGTTGAFI